MTTIEDNMTARCRLLLLASLLDPEDYRFVEARRPAIAKRFRNDRMKIFRAELWRIAHEVGSMFRTRASRFDAAGYWRGYPALLERTALTFYALAQLRLACLLFSWHLPVLIDVAASTNRLIGYAMAESPSAVS
jgi:hypothetical protein